MTKIRLHFLVIGFVALATWLGSSQDAPAQSRFSPVVQVGEAVITRHQLDQRTLFLSLLGAPGDPRELAREQLINEVVQTTAARRAGLAPTADAVQAGMAEFAGRANLEPEQFIQALGQNGVGAETFRDFVAAGVAWRDYVRDRFGETARDIPRPLIRRTLAQRGTEGGLRVLVSEILLPATSPETAAASRSRAATISALGSEEAFAAAARELSVSPSSSVGGELNWVALESLPDDVEAIIAGLTPGQISRPVELENAIGVFLLRDAERVAAGTPETLSVDYALFITDGDRAAAEAIARRVDVCDDLYGVAHGLPADRLIRETQPISSLPADIREEVQRLDQDEISTAISRNGRGTVLMLCDRRPALDSTVDIDIVGNLLLNTRLGAMAADHLADLRADTTVVDLSR